MKNWVQNRALDALLKTLAILAVLHVIILLLGVAFGNMIGWFGLRMFWAHWSGGWVSCLVAVLLTALVYGLTYTFASQDAG